MFWKLSSPCFTNWAMSNKQCFPFCVFFSHHLIHLANKSNFLNLLRLLHIDSTNKHYDAVHVWKEGKTEAKLSTSDKLQNILQKFSHMTCNIWDYSHRKCLGKQRESFTNFSEQPVGLIQNNLFAMLFDYPGHYYAFLFSFLYRS